MDEVPAGRGVVALSGVGRTFGRYRAFIFNMDGVVTDTTGLHAAAWRATFDRYLSDLSAQSNVEHVPFDPVDDYRRYMNGRLRYEAAAQFLAARGIALPHGSVGDPPGAGSVCSLVNDKQAEYLARLEACGVAVYPSTIALIDRLRSSGVGVGLVSSSGHCEVVLRAAGLTEEFDVIVSGARMRELGLPGKPDPAAFLEAARRLDIAPRSGVVVEDSAVGVQAAQAAGFGLVVGLAHSGDAEARTHLAQAADIVVSELGELDVTTAG